MVEDFGQKMLEMFGSLSKAIENVNIKIETLTTEVNELKKDRSPPKENLSKAQEHIPFMMHGGEPNEWLRSSGYAQQSIRGADPFTLAIARDTYKPTIEALRKRDTGATADEISKITNRKRNTESSYLNRLYLTGIVTRHKEGTKVIYNLVKDHRMLQLW